MHYSVNKRMLLLFYNIVSYAFVNSFPFFFFIAIIRLLFLDLKRPNDFCDICDIKRFMLILEMDNVIILHGEAQPQKGDPRCTPVLPN